jgi:hypothetical protein
VLRGSESSPPSGCCRGGLRGNSGGLGLNWRGEGVEEVQEGEGNLLVCGKRPGDAPFYRVGSGRGGAGQVVVDDGGTVAERSW